jgi:hypothetical protein
MSAILINKNYYLSHILEKKSCNFVTNIKMDMFVKKYMKKIHFSIFPKQNTFTKPKKLENCGNFIQKKPDDHKSRMIIKAG